MSGMMKNSLPPYHIVVGASMASNVTSSPTNIEKLDNILYQAQWTGTPTGTFNVQTSADYQQTSGGSVINAGTWVNVPLSASIAASGAADQAVFDLNQLPGAWVRLAYTASAGTGTLDVYVTGKAV